MKKSITLLFGLTISFILFSQAPDIRWQRLLGTPDPQMNNAYFNIKTNDNGFISVWRKGFGNYGLNVTKLNEDGFIKWDTVIALPYGVETAVSYVYNTDGSIVILGKANAVTVPIENVYDYYAAKVDANGNLLWEKYYGGTNKDVPSSIIKSVNGGYIIVGNSSSPELTNDANGNTDTYVIKITEAGIVEWQKDLGGNGIEGTSKNNGRGKVVESSDGSIYVLTETTSTDGDVTDNNGAQDIWLSKLNSAGLRLWSKSLGGTGNDYMADLKLTPSGELYVLGSTASPEYTTTGTAQQDFYFARVSTSGNILFEKSFGSTSPDAAFQFASVESDGTCVLAGTVGGGDGDVQGSHGGTNVWLVKINPSGTILWQNPVLSGTIYFLDEPSITRSSTGAVVKTSDGGFLITCNSAASYLVNYTFALQNMAAAKVSASGVNEWVRSFGGTGDDFPRGPGIELAPNVYTIMGNTNSKDHDVNNKNNGEYPWLITLAANNTIKGTLFLDLNSNGINDGEPPFSLGRVNIDRGAKHWELVPDSGYFELNTDTGSYVSTVTLNHPYYTVVPTQHTSSFSTFFNTDSFSFAVQPIPGIKDLVVNIVPLSPVRPGFIANYEIHYKNVGNVSVLSPQIAFAKDPLVNFISAIPAVSTTVGDTLKWNLATLAAGASGKITLNLRMSAPPTLNIGDTVNSLALITPIAGDMTPKDDSAYLSQILQGSFDPNDKAENHNGTISLGQVATGEYLNYVIRFQNMGTDVAFNIVVRDTLDPKLDWSTFEMVSASHSYQLQIDESDKLIWSFDDIQLPYSAQNEPASHGYIAYRIKPKAGLGLGANINNGASIYFDFNLPVETNVVSTMVGSNPTLPLHLVDFSANYQKPDAVLQWSTADEINVDKYIIERGTDPVHFAPVATIAAKGGSTNQYQFKDGLASTSGNKFYYRLRMVDQDSKYTYSNIQLVNREGKSKNELLINPNPVKGSSGFAWINFERATKVELGVFDMQGRYQLLTKQAIGKGFNVLPIQLAGLQSGTYVLQAKVDGKILVTRFVIAQ